jgi:acetyl-CoA carboxylase alpha subunit
MIVHSHLRAVIIIASSQLKLDPLRKKRTMGVNNPSAERRPIRAGNTAKKFSLPSQKRRDDGSERTDETENLEDLR